MNRLKLLQVWVVFTLVCMFSCNSTPADKIKNAPADSTSTEAETQHSSSRAAHWSYAKEDGPAEWANLSPAYALCGSGKSQSPIDLLPNAGKGSADWKINYITT